MKPKNQKTYAERMAELGIDRGQLGSRFEDETTAKLGAVPKYLSNDSTKPVIEDGPDLSHLNPKYSARASENFKRAYDRKRKERKKTT